MVDGYHLLVCPVFTRVPRDSSTHESADPWHMGHEAFRSSRWVIILNPYKPLAPPLPLPTGRCHRLSRLHRIPHGLGGELKNNGKHSVWGTIDMWSPTLQTLIGHLFQHVDDAENIVVSTVFELLEPMPSEICFMLWLQRENLGVQRQMPRSPRGSVPMNGWTRGWLDG